jgi:hypothetical protein
MWSEMNKLAFPEPKLIKLCKFEIMKYMLKLKSSKFKFNKRLRQGDAVAPLLFDIVWKSLLVAIKQKLGKAY